MGLPLSTGLKIPLFLPQVAVLWIAPATSPPTPPPTSRLPPLEGESLSAETKSPQMGSHLSPS